MPPLDYKKQARRLYLPSAVPAVVDVPEMQFFMVDGTGDPNAPDGEYSHALELLYTLSYAVRMGGKKGAFPAPDYLEYVVLPLEGLCVQCLHTGSYDDEPATLARMHVFMEQSGLRPDTSGVRAHHEIYLSDPRKTPAERLKTVLRLPVLKA